MVSKKKKKSQIEQCNGNDMINLVILHCRYEIFRVQLEGFVFIRRWFAENVLLDSPGRLCEYLLAAPLPEIRSCFAKLIVSFCHYSAEDEPVACFEGSNLCEQVLIAVLGLLKSDVPEHGKSLPHYFSLFSMYAGLGYREECQLIKVSLRGGEQVYWCRF